MTPDDFDALFDSFSSSVFRLEQLPSYAVGGAEEARLQATRAGQPRPERSVRTSPWLARIASSTAAGKSWTRVRVVDRPMTYYQRSQLVSYMESQAVGEQISVVYRDDVGGVEPDFWLFDAGSTDAHAVLMFYTTEGRIDRREPVTDASVIADLDLRRRSVEHLAVRLNGFLSTVGTIVV